MVVLNAENRTDSVNLNKLRRSGKIPAVFYGRKEKSTPITVSAKDFEKVWREAGETGLIDLTGSFGKISVLINDVSLDPIKNIPRHIDFYAIEKGQKVKVKVPLDFVGVAPAVKELGGTLVRVAYELELEAEPQALPKNLAVDISSLVDFKSQIAAKDLKLPLGVLLVSKPDEVLVLVSEAKEIEEEKPAEAVDLSQIEISEKRGKEEVEAAEGEAKGAAGFAKADAAKVPAEKAGADKAAPAKGGEKK